MDAEPPLLRNENADFNTSTHSPVGTTTTPPPSSVPPPPPHVDTETTQNPAFSIKRIVPYVKEYLKAYMWLQKTNPVTIASFMKSEDKDHIVKQEWAWHICNVWWNLSHKPGEKPSFEVASQDKDVLFEEEKVPTEKDSSGLKTNTIFQSNVTEPAFKTAKSLGEWIDSGGFTFNLDEFEKMRKFARTKRMSQLFVILIGGFFVIATSIGTGGVALPFWFMIGLASFGGLQFFKTVYEHFYRDDAKNDTNTDSILWDRDTWKSRVNLARHRFVNTTGMNAIWKLLGKVLSQLRTFFSNRFGSRKKNEEKFEAMGGTIKRRRFG